MSPRIRHRERKRQAIPAATAAWSMADAGFFFYGEYAYFWAYFFVSPHAERRVSIT